MVKIIFSWLEYILCLLFLLFIWIFFEKYGLFVLVLLWFFLPAYAYAAMKRAGKSCFLSGKMQSRTIGRKEENIFCLNIENKGFFVQGRIKLFLETEDLFFNEKSGFEIEIPLHTGKEEIKIPIRSLYSGIRRVVITKAEIPSMMGLFKMKKEFSVAAEYVVMPDKFPINSIGRVISGMGNDEVTDDDIKGNNSSQMREITEYRPGDRLQKIHWKATAKKDELMVKEYEGTLSDQVTIIAELVNDKRVLEDVLSLSFSLAAIKIDDTQKITFQWWNDMAGEWKRLILTSEEELEKGLEELFYCTPYEDRQKAYEQVLREGELVGSIIYVSDAASLGIGKNEKIEIDMPSDVKLLAGASLLRLA